MVFLIATLLLVFRRLMFVTFVIADAVSWLVGLYCCYLITLCLVGCIRFIDCCLLF